jgi:hypothetical protein
MRVQVKGNCGAAMVVRGYLTKAGFYVTGVAPDYVLHIESQNAAQVTIDAIDCEFERNLINMISEQLIRAGHEHAIVLERAGGIRSDREARIVVPADDKVSHAVEIGILNGFARTVRQPASRRDRLKTLFWRKLW